MSTSAVRTVSVAGSVHPRLACSVHACLLGYFLGTECTVKSSPDVHSGSKNELLTKLLVEYILQASLLQGRVCDTKKLLSRQCVHSIFCKAPLAHINNCCWLTFERLPSSFRWEMYLRVVKLLIMR